MVTLDLKEVIGSKWYMAKANLFRRGRWISPLIANIYLNEFDQFMKTRNYRIVRYADDILVLCGSRRSAEHASEVASTFLEKTLKLKVNRGKTHITHCRKGIRYLGVEIFCNFTKIQEKKMKGFKRKVKEITKRNQGKNLEMVITGLNPQLRGFSNYFRIANCKGVFEELMGWIKRRLRAIQLKLWKKPSRLHRRLRQRGYKGEFQKIKMASWRNSASPLASLSMPNKWFYEIGLYNMDKRLNAFYLKFQQLLFLAISVGNSYLRFSIILTYGRLTN